MHRLGLAWPTSNPQGSDIFGADLEEELSHLARAILARHKRGLVKEPLTF